MRKGNTSDTLTTVDLQETVEKDGKVFEDFKGT